MSHGNQPGRRCAAGARLVSRDRRRAVARRLAVVLLPAVGLACSGDPRPNRVSPLSATARRAAQIAAVQASAPAGYHFAAQGAEHVADNAAQGFRVAVGSEGIRLRAAVGAPWRLDLRLARWGCDGDLAPVPPARRRAAGGRVSSPPRRDAPAEWLVNGPLGLEQGFTLAAAPSCAGRDGGEVVLEVALAGDLAARLTAAGDAVELRHAAGQAALRYADLHAEDAGGRELPARLALAPGAITIRVAVTGAAFPVTIDPLIAVLQQKLVASPLLEYGALGTSVSVSGDTAVVGAPSNGQLVGSAYVFTRAGTTWSQQQVLTPGDGVVGDRFGQGVGVAGGTIAVGADWAQVGTNVEQGAVYVYTFDGMVWQPTKLTASDGVAFDHFGKSVAVSGARVVVGATGTGGTNRGAAYVYSWDGSGWQEAKLTASDGAASDYFGNAVAIDGDTAVVGAYYAPVGANARQGAAYVYTWSGTDWQEAKLTASDGAASDYFGYSVAVDGGNLLVGAYRATASSLSQQGKVYAYAWGGSSWEPSGVLTEGAEGAAGDRFGSAVALAGDLSVVGAANADGYRGVAYAFAHSGSWEVQARFAPGDLSTFGDYFGGAVALDGTSAVVGASHQAQNFPGAAYAFVLNGGACGGEGDCGSGHCVDGVCCESACGQPCDACNGGTRGWGARDGECTVAPLHFAGEPSCSPNLCDGVAAACPTSCAGDADCDSASYCGAAGGGTCVAIVAAGEACACQQAGCRACGGGLDCVDGYCCDEPCGEPCRTCAATPGTCTVVTGADDADTCSGVETCDADGACKLTTGQACPGGSTTCASGVCTGGFCVPAVCGADGDCPSVLYCGADHQCHVPRTLTAACDATAGGDCAEDGCGVCGTNACVDNFCCNSACTGACMSCGIPGYEGTCSPLPQYAHDTFPAAACVAPQACSGTGQCLNENGGSCTPGCASGHCVDGLCCDSACTGPCVACALAGFEGQCTPLPRFSHGRADDCPSPQACDGAGTCANENGGDCAGGCASGNCADGVCCDTPCTGTCLACNLGGAVGVCSPVPRLQEDANGSPSCAAPTGACDGQGACKLAAGQTCAAAAACATGFCVDGVCCDGACTEVCHRCSAAGACGYTAAGAADDFPTGACAAPDACDGAGTCLKSNGADCATPAECQSGSCVDGVCCATACDSTCSYCNYPGHEGECQPVPDGDDPRHACQAASGGVAACAGACQQGQCAFPDVGKPCGLCAACDGTGRCTATPADDDVCGTIDCSGLDTACRVYTDLTTGRCASLGSCKAANDPGSCTVFADLACGDGGPTEEDAGAPGADGAAPADAGPGGADAAGGSGGGDSGGCRASGAGAPTGLLHLALGLWLLRRRRRRR